MHEWVANDDELTVTLPSAAPVLQWSHGTMELTRWALPFAATGHVLADLHRNRRCVDRLLGC